MSIDDMAVRSCATDEVTPRAVEARLMPWAATMRAVWWAVGLAVSLTFFYFGLVMGSFVPWLALPITVIGVLAALYCAWRLWRAMQARKLDAPVIVIGPEGFLDRRFGRAVPWQDVAGLEVDQPGTRTFLRVTAADPARFVARGRMLRRRVARQGALVSCLSEMDVSPAALVAAAEAHKAAA